MDDSRTLSVPEAGARYFNLGREGSYSAARRGQLPVIRISPRRVRVPVAALELMLKGATAEEASRGTAPAPAGA